MRRFLIAATLIVVAAPAGAQQYTDGPFMAAYGNISQFACKHPRVDGWCPVPGENVATIPLPRPSPLKAMAKAKGRPAR